jgi:formamidopyrimidine-DNA glycosylase
VPELPDVEGYRRYWSRYMPGERVRGVSVPTPAIVRNRRPDSLRRSLSRRRLGHPDRRGKWLLAPTDGPTLLLHFGMTGALDWTSRSDSVRHRHDRLILVAGAGEIRYRNMRMLGGVWLARNDGELEEIIGALGPDAGRLEQEDLNRLLQGRRGGIKATLMNQRIVAGIGNELSDEILWRARVHPAHRVNDLSSRKLDLVAAAVRAVIAESVPHGRIPREPGWLEEHRGSRGVGCPRCGRTMRRSRIAGRTSYWCPRCQRP